MLAAVAVGVNGALTVARRLPVISTVADLLSATQKILSLAQRFQGRVEFVQANQSQFTDLAKRVGCVMEQVQGLVDKISSTANQKTGKIQDASFPRYYSALNSLLDTLDQCNEAVDSFAQAGFLRRLLRGTAHADTLVDLNERLKYDLSLLNTGFQAENIFRADEDRIARTQDKQDILAKLNAIYAQEHTIEQNLVKLNFDIREKDEIAKKQLDSLHYYVEDAFTERHSAEKSMLRKLSNLERGLEQSEDNVQKQCKQLTLMLEQVLQQNKHSTAHLFLQELRVPFHQLQICKEIGQGAFGTIYQGFLYGDPIAIKEVKNADNPKIYSQFLREIKIMGTLRSPHITRLIGACDEEHRQYILMEYMENKSLDQYLIRQILSIQQRQDLLLAVAKGLRSMHSQDIYHRDLKTANILVNARGEAKIGDFGLTKASKKMDLETAEDTTNSYATAFLAPERLNYNPLSEPLNYEHGPADIYSFAILMWQVLTNCEPYAQYEPLEIIQQVKAKQRLTIPDFVPIFYRDLLTLCWDPNPRQRPRIQEIITYLQDYTPLDTDAILSKGLKYEKKEAYTEARQYYEQALQYGSIRAGTNLGSLHCRGLLGPADTKKGHDLFLSSALAGHTRAMINLASLYEKGFEQQEPDLKKARFWLQTASTAGDTTADKRLTAIDTKLAAHVGRGSPHLFQQRLEPVLKKEDSSKQAALRP